MSTRTETIIVIIGLLLIMLALYAAPRLPATPVGQGPATDVPAAGPITVRGTIVCLPHKGDGDYQTLECAYGVQDEQGRYFALKDSDPEYKNVGNAPMNVPVTVVGTFAPDDGGNYRSVGTITVTSITRADVPQRQTFTGVYLCLPHKNPGDFTTEECAFGIRTDNGTYYALDLRGAANELPAFSVGDRITVAGLMTPVEALSSNQWMQYPIRGIISADSVTIAK